jgi:hypothetical protein
MFYIECVSLLVNVLSAATAAAAASPCWVLSVQQQQQQQQQQPQQHHLPLPTYRCNNLMIYLLETSVVIV